MKNSFAYQTVTVYGRTFQIVPLTMPATTAWSYNPSDAVTSEVWAGPRSLATTGGIIVYFLFLQVLRCFSSLRSPPTLVGYRSFRPVGCPIRKSADQRSFAPTRSLSQLITSFIASESQGIRHVPFLTCLTSLTCARSVYTFSLYLFTFQFCFCNIMSKIVCPMINTWTKWRITDSNR